jgi:hypothetical protein
MTLTDILGNAKPLDPSHEILREVVAPLPALLEQAWRAYDRLQEQVVYLQHNPPRVEDAEQRFRRELLEAALSDTEPLWPSAEGVLRARHDLEAHKATELAVHQARRGAEVRVGGAIVACERHLVEVLDDMLGQLQDDAVLRDAARAVPLGVGGDGLLAAGPDTARQAALLGDAAGRYDRIKAARRVVFEYVAPEAAPWIAVYAEDQEDGLTWKSQFVRGENEKPPWTGGPGGELHYALTAGVRLRCLTAEQLDETGINPPGIYLQAVRM